MAGHSRISVSHRFADRFDRDTQCQASRGVGMPGHMRCQIDRNTTQNCNLFQICIIFLIAQNG